MALRCVLKCILDLLHIYLTILVFYIILLFMQQVIICQDTPDKDNHSNDNFGEEKELIISTIRHASATTINSIMIHVIRTRVNHTIGKNALPIHAFIPWIAFTVDIVASTRRIRSIATVRVAWSPNCKHASAVLAKIALLTCDSSAASIYMLNWFHSWQNRKDY